jgi:hypothetical protein
LALSQRDQRRNVKKYEVLASLRGSIVRGEWRPGERLPNRDQLEARFKTSGVTIQKALSQLIADGFVHAKRRNGTFVSDQLPHQSRYGVVFDAHRNDPQYWRRFWSCLHQQLPVLEHNVPRELPAYFGISHANEPDYERLIDDLHSHRLAGLILTSVRCVLPGTFLAEAEGVPKVVLHSAADEFPFPQVALDHEAWMDRALEFVRRAGRRRVAVLTHGGLFVDHGEDASTRLAFKRHGLGYDPYRVQCADLHYASTAENLVRLMLGREPADRPDALLITDDNLVDPALIGLIAEGIRVPDDLTIVTHCNFPCPRPSVLDVKRLGFDADTVLNACLAIIDQQRADEPALQRTVISPVFEEERTSEHRPEPGLDQL